ncbi:hypothetical protein [Aliikangiella coralliicola]|uniref:Uncharacterized protein n=1 Tax=Aliikangiella coralliicola TaxID=2592383 RepID=A0A545UF78_9GAMM|nr:hypothetical protein [Aliikangiella coralliicola]TQV88118.1 hypothetical protein FLL46_06215 [Aliikangiella coralliicola]
MPHYFSRKRNDIDTLKTRINYLGDHCLLTFNLPGNASQSQIDLAYEIGDLDKRAHRQLGARTAEWEAVVMLLVNAISIGIQGNAEDKGRNLCSQARDLLEHYVAVFNRVNYLIGMSIGVLISILVMVILFQFEEFLAPYFSVKLVVMICLFAGMGSIASVVTRVLKMETLKQEMAATGVMISAAGKPVVAMFFAIVVYLILEQGIVTIDIGSSENSDKFYLVVGFLCGFSERFAQDIIERISGSQ